ncbi:hypothetical protein EIP86_003290 [Pleurotus ostreatoroseus]|nr:hypothetical protein EIP86_003290 [Pleurotus ostreatoroseus]
MATTTEFDILKASHRFLRDEQEPAQTLPWEEKLAQKYYSSLYREFAVCDLKHYKSGNFALRWRTEEEVVSGAGESTCGNTRCALHSPRNIDPQDPRASLKTLELPFSYLEEGENKLALVKVVLCDKCCQKLMYKRNKEKGRLRAAGAETSGAEGSTGASEDTKEEQSSHGVRSGSSEAVDESGKKPKHSGRHEDRDSKRRHEETRRHRDSRSRSPRRRDRHSDRPISPSR